jgi:lipopolysaccharide export system permease protein
MNKIILNYLLKNFLKTVLMWVMIFYCFGVILNLFEEIEFFKNIEADILMPLMLTSIFIPSMIIQLLPFIIFISSMWFMIKIRNNRDLLTMKVFGYSNIKIFFILAITSFILGWIILFIANPITSSMSKYYEKTKSNYARDIDHLVTFNKNGLWIKENTKNGQRIITADKPDGFYLIDVTIFHLDKDYNLTEKIISKKVNIKDNNWELINVELFKPSKGVFERKELETLKIQSIYNFEKITTLFKNFDTMSFLDLILNYKELINNGYNQTFLNQSLHSLLSLPFFLLLMTAIASILTMNTLKKSDNLKFTVLGLIISVFVFYFKDLSLALGQTDRIPLILAVWAPVIALTLFTFIGILQINEK